MHVQASGDNWLTDCIVGFCPDGVSFDEGKEDRTLPKSTRWMKKKLNKHIGFILGMLILCFHICFLCSILTVYTLLNTNTNIYQYQQVQYI